MTRKEFIDRFISILICRTSCSQIEVDEFRLMLELMPDKDKLEDNIERKTDNPGLITWPSINQPWNPLYPYTTTGTITTGDISSNITNTDIKDTKLKTNIDEDIPL